MFSEPPNIRTTCKSWGKSNNLLQDESPDNLQSSSVLHQNILNQALQVFESRFATSEVILAAQEVSNMISTALDPSTPPIVLVTGYENREPSCFGHEVCQSLGQPVSFFYQRSDTYKHGDTWSPLVVRKFFPTIAYQIAATHPNERWNTDICNLVRSDTSILSQSLSTQLQSLITKPMSSVRMGEPIVIVIDGLDNSTPKELQDCILKMLHIPQLQFVITRPPTTCQWIEDGVVEKEKICFFEIPVRGTTLRKRTSTMCNLA